MSCPPRSSCVDPLGLPGAEGIRRARPGRPVVDLSRRPAAALEPPGTRTAGPGRRGSPSDPGIDRLGRCHVPLPSRRIAEGFGSACASRGREVGRDRAAGVGDVHERGRGDERSIVPGHPRTPRAHPVVLILRGVAGPDDGYTEIARGLAEWGYVALLHGWKVRGANPPDAPVYDDLKGALTFLRSVSLAVQRRLGEFCFLCGVVPGP